MAAALIQFDSQADPMRSVVRALQMIREGVETLGHARGVMVQACDGSTDTAAHFALLATLGTFQAGGYADANAAALAAWQQIDSLYAILTKPSGQGDAAGAALAQACGMLGV
jgi:hypothetical protein